jgi:anti-sigma factor RsiW
MRLLDRITMRRCRQVAAVLQEYLDGEVDPATAGTVHDHLEECRRCGLEASTYRAIKAAIPAADARITQIDVDPEAVRRLRRFADDLAHPRDTSGS